MKKLISSWYIICRTRFSIPSYINVDVTFLIKNFYRPIWNWKWETGEWADLMAIECKIRVTWYGTSKGTNLKVPIKKIIEYCEDCSMTYFTHRKFKTYLFHCFSSFTILYAGIRCEKYVHFLFTIWVILPSNLLLLGYPRPMVGYYALAWLCKRKKIAIPLNIDTPAFCDCDHFVYIYINCHY